MLQLQYIKDHREECISRLKIKNVQNVEERIAEIIELDAQRRALQVKADAVKAEQNRMAKEIGMLMKQGLREEAEKAKARTAELKGEEKALGEEQAATEKTLNEKLISLPNAPHPSVPAGKSEADNVVVGEYGTKPDLPADALPHWDLCAKYDIIDFELGNKVTGAGFPFYKGKGARLQRALINFFLNEAADAGFVETNYVIANMNPQDAYTKLLDKRIKVPDREIKRLNAQKHGVRFFEAYVGLNKSVEELGINDYTIFMPGELDNGKNFAWSKSMELNTHSVVVIYNVANPEASPKGTTAMTFAITYTEHVWGTVSQRDYSRKKTELFQKVLENFEKDTGIIIHDCIEEIEMASPWTFCNFLGTPQGTVYGYEVNEWDTMVSRLLTLRKEQPIHGFKTCGAAGARSDGFNQTYLNGNDMAMLLLEEMEQDAKEGK